MKKRSINIIALLVLTILFVGGIYNAWSWFNLQNRIDKTNQKVEERSKLGQKYNTNIGSIYKIAESDLNTSLKLIEQSRTKFPNKLNDLDYVEARILLMNNQKEKSEILVDRLRQNSNSVNPRLSGLYAYLQIEKCEIEIAERHLKNASQVNEDYKYQLANLYEVKSDLNKAIELYNEIIDGNSFYKNKAQIRRNMIENKTIKPLKNIELKDDSKRVHFSIEKLNIK